MHIIEKMHKRFVNVNKAAFPFHLFKRTKSSLHGKLV